MTTTSSKNPSARSRRKQRRKSSRTHMWLRPSPRYPRCPFGGTCALLCLSKGNLPWYRRALHPPRKSKRLLPVPVMRRCCMRMTIPFLGPPLHALRVRQPHQSLKTLCDYLPKQTIRPMQIGAQHCSKALSFLPARITVKPSMTQQFLRPICGEQRVM